MLPDFLIFNSFFDYIFFFSCFLEQEIYHIFMSTTLIFYKIFFLMGCLKCIMRIFFYVKNILPQDVGHKL